jgi:orotate phosphoribosyltransferase
LSRERLSDLAVKPFGEVAERLRGHVDRCPRCAYAFAAFRSVECISKLPERLSVALTGLDLPRDADNELRSIQVLGRINLENPALEACSEDEWVGGPMFIRLNLVIDEWSDFLALTLLDVPDDMERVSLVTPLGQQPLSRASDGAYEFTGTLAEFGSGEGPRESFLTHLNAGIIHLAFEKRPQATDGHVASEVLGVLEEAGAIEREFDYVLPSGLHSDTHVRLGKVCHSEDGMRRIAAAFSLAFEETEFDAVVASGWALTMIARRFALARARDPGGTGPHVILSEGYSRPRLLGDLAPGSKVLILTDVVVSGGLTRRLVEVVGSCGARVVAVGAVVQSQHLDRSPVSHLRALCRVKMHIVAERDCPRCGKLDRREFNPFSYSMTAKAPTARSPSEFLEYDASAREFWSHVDRVGAYEHHRIERGAHYLAFVDTLKLLQHPGIGPELVRRLRDLVVHGGLVPDVLLVPRLQRAQHLGDQLQIDLGEKAPGGRVGQVLVRRFGGRWPLTPRARSRLRGRSVLVVDSAVGHGRTLDELSLLALENGARTVGGAFILSRLTESAEEAFRARLSGGFCRLYHLPVRPVLIHGHKREFCPVCQRKQAVSSAADESRLEAIRQLALSLSQKPRRCSAIQERDLVTGRTRQRCLFPEPDSSFLEGCRSQVASGVTLHSLHASMNNGMAPLALPEIENVRIPARNRVAMLENLPTGVLEWSKGYLDRDLEGFLARVIHQGLWRAGAGVFAREHHRQWIAYLGDLLERSKELRCETKPTFWNSMVCNAYLAVQDDPSSRGEMRQHLEALLIAHEGTPAAIGLGQILEAILL